MKEKERQLNTLHTVSGMLGIIEKISVLNIFFSEKLLLGIYVGINYVMIICMTS